MSANDQRGPAGRSPEESVPAAAAGAPPSSGEKSPNVEPEAASTVTATSGSAATPSDAVGSKSSPTEGSLETSAPGAPDGAFEAIVQKVVQEFQLEAPPPTEGRADSGADVSSEPDAPKDPDEGSTPPPTAGAADGGAPAQSQPAPTPQPSSDKPTVPLSLAHSSSRSFVVVEVPVHRLAGLLNVVGAALAAAHFADVRFWVGRRPGSPAAPGVGRPHGLIVEVGEKSTDPLATIVASGLPVPTACWHTDGGFKGLWAFEQPAFPETFTAVAEQFTVALSGGSPASWDPAAGHHLPIGLGSTGGGVVHWYHPALQTKPDPYWVAFYSPMLPSRLDRSLSQRQHLSDVERQQVQTYLVGIGLAPPSVAGGHASYRGCPLGSHGSTCCYVSLREDGSTVVTCLDEHGKEGRKTWDEVDLFFLATGTRLPVGGIDSVANIPATWAGQEYFRARLADLFGGPEGDPVMAAAVRVWMRAKASIVLEPLLKSAYLRGIQLKGAPPWHRYVAFYERRLVGDEAGPCQVFFDEVRNDLRLVSGDGSKPLTVKGQTLSASAHRHEYHGSLAYDLHAKLHQDEESQEWSIVLSARIGETAPSLWNKSLSGNSGYLAALGLPRMTLHELPVAFVESSVGIEAKTKCIEIVRTARMKQADASFDARAFFTKLFQDGRLPLATEADVPRLLMAIASPLLRDLAPGLLGIYWFIGPSGAGKDYLAGIVEWIWRRSVLRPVPAAFDLHLTDELEQKRAFATAGSAVYARAKEAGKSIDMVNMLIKLAGTDQVTARALFRDELQRANTFTYLADSVEDLPERKEISRRTVMIGVSQMEDEVSMGRVRDEILERAPDIIGNLKAMVESHAREWFLEQAKTGSRPVVPVALAQLFGATLPQVTGGGTDELFENMAAYLKTFGGEEGKAQLEGARDKDGKEMKLFPSYRLAHFVDQMSQEVGSRNFFKRYGSNRGIEMLLHREADYHTVESGKRPYLPVTINGSRFAFKLVKGKRNFVLVEELKYCSSLGIQPISAAPAPDNTSGDTAAPATPPVADPPATQPMTGPRRFTPADLRDEPSEVANASNGK